MDHRYLWEEKWLIEMDKPSRSTTKMTSLKLEQALVSINLKVIRRIGQIMVSRVGSLSTIAILSACNAAAQSTTIGIISIHGNDEWHLYTVRQIAAADKIVVQIPGKVGKAECCMLVEVDGAKRRQTDVVVTDEHRDQEVWSYKLKSVRSAEGTRPFVGIAVIGDVSNSSGDGALVRVKNGSRTTVVSTCLGSEGVNILARQNMKLTGRLYFYLGYSISTTCTDEMLE